MSIYYQGSSVTIYHGDCLEVIRELPDNSVDSVVCDPPYGLEFMGKEWDSFGPQRDARTAGRAGEGAVTSSSGITATGYTDGGKRLARAAFGTSKPTTWRCGRCNKRDQFQNHSPKVPDCDGTWLKEPVYEGAPRQMLAFQQWCELWAAECLRVLRPGGHLLAFGGTRTWHRLAVAVEDAGFEMRDSIAWLYGSGFPKSLDVSKAIDKRPGVTRHAEFVAHLIERREAAGLSRADVSERVVGTRSGACWNWEHHQFPEAKWWPALRDLLGMDGGKWDAVIADAERAKTGTGTSGKTYGMGGLRGVETSTGEFDVTAPATEAAQQWQGWGTALKPGWEGVVAARKPPSQLDMMGSRLSLLEDQCRHLVKDAESSSRLTRAASPEAKTVSAHASAATQHAGGPEPLTETGAAADSSAVTDTSASESTGEMCWSIVTSWRRCLDELSPPTSTSTTSTTTGPTIDLATLWSSLSKITDASTHLTDPTSPDGLSSLARVVDNLFGGALLTSRATRELTATDLATSPTRQTSQDGEGPQLEPIVVARKPLAGTVAANVQQWGTGALNVDGCRIGTDVMVNPPGGIPNGANNYVTTKPRNRDVPGTVAAGRWPANVVLDEDAAAELDEQSGTLTSGAHTATERRSTVGGNGRTHGAMAGSVGPQVEASSGGASRFFYTAKAGKSERPVGEDGTAHPTVKPLALMRWLVRLVTPPGGTVLEPFAGSGTTVEAAMLEGFRCVAVEREADYLPLILHRVARAEAAVAAAAVAAADVPPSLFDEEQE